MQRHQLFWMGERRADWSDMRIAAVGAYMKKMNARGHENCGVSSGFAHEELTFGRGELDDQGYWEIPCRLCAETFEHEHPDMAKEHGVWPSREQYAP